MAPPMVRASMKRAPIEAASVQYILEFLHLQNAARPDAGSLCALALLCHGLGHSFWLWGTRSTECWGAGGTVCVGPLPLSCLRALLI